MGTALDTTKAPVGEPTGSPTAAQALRGFASSRDGVLAIATLVAIALHLILKFGFGLDSWAADWPLVAIVVVGGVPLTIHIQPT